MAGLAKAVVVAVAALALCLSVGVSEGKPMKSPLIIRGRVYCDTCLAGFETSKTSYIPGAEVEAVCKERKTMIVRYTRRARTDSTGSYKIPIYEDHGDQVCEVYAVNSNMLGCTKQSKGREAARVPLTVFNGIASNIRHANAIAFERDEAMAGCAEVLKQYQESDD